jgi:hypothetical protein
MRKILIVVIFILGMALQSCEQGEKEILILPKNFTGYIIIVYNQNNGSPAKLENGKRVYRIPEDGILKSQFSNNTGWKDLPEFYYERIEKANQIPFKIDYKDISVDSVVAYGGTSGVANKDLAGKEVVRFVEYYVGNKQQIDSAYQKAEKLDIINRVNKK